MFLAKLLFKINHFMKNRSKLYKYFTSLETTYEIINGNYKNICKTYQDFTKDQSTVVVL